MQFIRKSDSYALFVIRKTLRGELAPPENPNMTLTGDDIMALMSEFNISIADVVAQGYAARTVNSWRLYGRQGEDVLMIMHVFQNILKQSMLQAA